MRFLAPPLNTSVLLKIHSIPQARICRLSKSWGVQLLRSTKQNKEEQECITTFALLVFIAFYIYITYTSEAFINLSSNGKDTSLKYSFGIGSGSCFEDFQWSPSRQSCIFCDSLHLFNVCYIQSKRSQVEAEQLEHNTNNRTLCNTCCAHTKNSS